MKLKKIAALALAGVMAVSMLAGCAGKGTDDKKDPTTGTSTAFTNDLVAALEKKVEAHKDYITVGTDATLQKNLESATALYGLIATESNIEAAMKTLDSSLSTTALPAVNATTAYENAVKSNSVFTVAKVDYNDQNQTTYQLVQSLVSTLMADTTLGGNGTLERTLGYGKSYGAYSSTGLDGKQTFTGLNFKYQINVATVKVENTAVEGSGCYVVAVTVTRTATPVAADDANFGKN